MAINHKENKKIHWKNFGEETNSKDPRGSANWTTTEIASHERSLMRFPDYIKRQNCVLDNLMKEQELEKNGYNTH